jgi:ATP-dependent Clp protease ATP-binding subunit ClpA
MSNSFGNSFDADEGPEAGAIGPIPEAQKILQGLLAELPDKAVALMDKVDREIAKVQEQAEAEVSRVREKAERQVAEIESKADGRRKALLEHAMEQLEPLQKDLFRTGELGKALATYVQLQALKGRVENVLPDPGNLLQFQQVGKTFHFRVVGNSRGPIWGTDTYTLDSQLAASAIHSGALEEGEEGVVRVSVVDMAGQPVKGSHRNGAMSMDWGPYPMGYRVVRA